MQVPVVLYIGIFFNSRDTFGEFFPPHLHVLGIFCVYYLALKKKAGLVTWLGTTGIKTGHSGEV